MSDVEIMTILVLFHTSHHHDRKHPLKYTL
jgi:hypothetical protein